MLASPKFLFRAEPDPPNVAAGAIYPVSRPRAGVAAVVLPVEHDSRRRAAQRGDAGKLRQPAVLEQQVRRMLADPTLAGARRQLRGQWLLLRNLQSLMPDSDEFPNFDDDLRQAFRQETELFFESIMREDRSVLDLLTADYTFVNERLARHYGIPNVYGSHFRRVTLHRRDRRGLLGQGSI